MGIYRAFTMAGALALLGGAASFAATACPALENSTPASRLEYLQGERPKLNPACVVVAIQQLGYDQYAPAIKVLVGYLDYRDPAKMPGFRQAHVEWSGSIYPAGSALAQIGKPSVPELLKAIAEESTSELVRNNASDAVFAIYDQDLVEGVAVLARAARAQTDPYASIHLMDQARRQAARCGNELRNDCENAIVRESH